jgi:hypothetical protein
MQQIKTPKFNSPIRKQNDRINSLPAELHQPVLGVDPVVLRLNNENQKLINLHYNMLIENLDKKSFGIILW